MMVKRRMIILLSLVLLVTFIMTAFLWSMRDDLPLEMSSNFGIVFTYGYQQAQGYSGLDTLQELIIKDLVMDGVVETHCTLSKKALGEIYGLLRKVHITRYPSEYRSSLGDFFQFRGQRTVTPSMVYSLKVYDGDNLVHSVYWHDSSLSGTIRARSLRKCFSEIINIIENTEEFKKLPEKRGAYA